MAEHLVVLGLGYVGMPLAREGVRVGMRVTGLDTDVARVAALADGRSFLADLPDSELRELLQRGFLPTTDGSVLEDADVAVICVPTPLSESGGPDLTAVLGAVRQVAAHLHPGMLVVLTSTTYPGTTEDIVRPILEERGLRAGSDFHLAYSPERIDPGNTAFGLRNTPKIVGGCTAACTARAAGFFSQLVDTVVEAKGTQEAEMAKLLENTYRHINIALVNEVAKFSHELGVDFWDVIRCASTKPFGFQAFRPGPGVGGHCIPIDPRHYPPTVRVRQGTTFRFVELAHEINTTMPAYVARRAQDLLNEDGSAVAGSTVLLLGITYKPDVSDQRESPARPLAEQLLRRGAVLAFHDPFVPAWSVAGQRLRRVPDLDAALAQADLTILLQPHSAYDLDRLAHTARRLFDTRGVVQVDGVVAL
jgi:nucleotide sugar dehydrogenase